jgi:hypothetical protein
VEENAIIRRTFRDSLFLGDLEKVRLVLGVCRSLY